MNLAHEINDFLYALGWGDIRVTHYFNSVELYDAFPVFSGKIRFTTFKVEHSQITSGEATPLKIAKGIIDDIRRSSATLGDRVNISRYDLDFTKETLKQAATDISILINRELEDKKKAEENGVDTYLSLENFYRFDLENVNRLINKLTRL